MIDIEALKAELFKIMDESVKGLWEEEDKDFIKKLAQDVAEQKLKQMTSAHPTDHTTNLRFIAATMDGEMIRHAIKVQKKSRGAFELALAAVIRTVASQVLRV